MLRFYTVLYAGFRELSKRTVGGGVCCFFVARGRASTGPTANWTHRLTRRVVGRISSWKSLEEPRLLVQCGDVGYSLFA